MARLVNISRMLISMTAFTMAACGMSGNGRGPAGPGGSSIEAAFYRAASTTGMSARMMMAVGYLESRLSATNAVVNYRGPDALLGDAPPLGRGTIMTQSAFGVPLTSLGLDGSKSESASLEAQIDAYAHWLEQQFKEAGVSLNPNPNSSEDKFYWISNLAKVHRRGMDQRRNVQILFARELVQLLNRGFIWQDRRTGAKLELPKEGERLTIEKFPVNGQQWFRLVTPNSGADLGVTPLPLVPVAVTGGTNKPNHVEVIHCPLNLSACLELQTRANDSEVKLAGHYIVPPILPNDAGNDPVLNGIFQVADYSQTLTVTDEQGNPKLIEDAVVIVLTGNSGRIQEGSRQPALPNWLTDGQLRAMAQVISNVCTAMSQTNPIVKRDECLSMGGSKGVRFRRQLDGRPYVWGDIADFDFTIMQGYLTNPGGLSTDVQFDASSNGRVYQAGDSMPLTVLFDSAARILELERLARCPSGRVVWEPLRIAQVRAQTRLTMNEVIHDSGPNRNGEQFFRLRAYGGDGHLVGWTIGNVLLRSYEKEEIFASDRYCGQAG
ncbi:MAG: hypothetical protein RL011_2315 [Pseudomonadota bacterium]